MATATLPRELTDKLQTLGRHVRHWRVTAGAGRFAAAVLLGLATAVALDAALDLPPALRGWLLGVWLFGSAVAAYAWLWRPWACEPDARDLACAVEQLHPRLGERLTSAVELCRVEGGHYGSPELVRLLLHEADLKTRALDFEPAAPAHSATRVLLMASPVLIGVAALAVWQGEQSLQSLGRLIAPWRPTPAPFTVGVSPGDVTVARGKPLTVAVQLRPNFDAVKLPTAATLVVTGADGRPTRLAMNALDNHQFEYAFTPDADKITYTVEAGRGRGATHTVRVVEPVNLAADSPKVVIDAPAYARSTTDAQTVTGVQDLCGLQYSRVTWNWKFDRPAADARLKVVGLASLREAASRLNWSDDRQSLNLELYAAAPHGAVQLTVVGEAGVLTELPEQPVRSIADEPPTFVQVRGVSDAPRNVTPQDTLPIEVRLADDFGVASLAIEFRVGNLAYAESPVELKSTGRDVKAAFRWKISDKATVGETIQYRLKATDNRRVPAFDVGPNVTYYPPGDRWATLRVGDKAESMGKQEAVAKRGEVDRELKQIIENLKREARAIYALHNDIARDRSLPEEQEPRLLDVRDMNRDTEQKLEELAQKVEQADGLQPLAKELRDIAETVKEAGEWVRDAGTRQDKRRIDPLKTAERLVEEARKQLEKVPQTIDKLVKEQSEREQLDQLADKQERLADKADDADTAKERQKLEQQQRELAEQLQRATEASEPIREAMKEAAPEAMAKLADKAKELAAAEKNLDQKANDLKKQMDERQSEAARKQQEIAAKVAELGQQTQTAARAASAEPVKPDAAKRAAEALQKGENHHAAGLQDQTARELDQLAEQLDRAAERAKSPAEAARQLARAQEAVRQQLPQPSASSEQMKKDQQQIRDAAAQLPKGDNPQAAQKHADAIDKLDKAAAALNQADKAATDRQMSQARQALEQLAASLGNQPASQQSPSVAKPEQAQAARDLAAQQRQLQQQTKSAAQQQDRDGTNPESVRQEQQRIQRQTEQLANDLAKAANQLPQQAVQMGQQAEQAARRAHGQMNTAGHSRDAQPASQARQEAMKELGKAAEMAQQSSQAGRAADQDAPPNSDGQSSPGESLNNAKDQMNQARQQLKDGQSKDAGESMRQAAESMRNALDQMNQSMRDQNAPQGGQPADAARPDKAPIVDQLPPALREHAGKKWGELPGELRTRIVQELKAQYGDDYARVIKHYFEQIADRKQP